MEGNLTCGVKHTIQYTDDALQNCTPETYIILLAHVTPIGSIKNFKNKQKVSSKDQEANETSISDTELSTHFQMCFRHWAYLREVCRKTAETCGPMAFAPSVG